MATCHDITGGYYCTCKEGWVGNGVNCTDITPPILFNLPNSTETVNTPGQGWGVVTWSQPYATDNSEEYGFPLTFIESWESGTQFPVGTTEVSIVAQDFAGLITSYIFYVTVNGK